MYLLLDLSERDSIHIALFNESIIEPEQVSGRNRELLSVVENFLSQKKLTKNDVKGIMVVVGAGGFTNTRIAIVVANTFAYSEKVSLLVITKDQVPKIQELIGELLQQPIGQYLSATYSAAPNITAPKSTL
jgi:tRNA A37 threonylcarbamoyladenosine modification protein TsaB